MDERVPSAEVGRNSPDDIVARAPDFALYGLDESWTGPRWISGLSGPGPLATVGLGHLSADCSRGVVVTTLARERYDRWRSDGYDDPVEAVAVEATNELLGSTWPDAEVMREADWLDDVVDHADGRARDYRSWAAVSWLVDGAATQAVSWRFAGAWTGFTTALSDVYVIVTAVGVEPETVRLQRLTDGARYGFDLGADITIRHMGTGGPLPNANREGFHLDHYAVRRHG